MNDNKNERMTEIFNTYYGLLMYAILQEIDCYDDVLDICQDVCVAFYCQYGNEEMKNMPDMRAKALLMKIMHNKIVDYIRKRTRSPMLYLTDYEEVPYVQEKTSYTIEDSVMNRELLREIGQDLMKADEFWRDAFVLRAVTDLSYEQLSEILDVSPQVLRTRVHRYRKLLRKKYEDDI